MAHRRKRGHFNVEPRYTPGSPALVDEITAHRVAKQEKHFYEHALEGVWGETEQKKAQERGLDFIAFEMVERPKGWEIHDLITGKEHFWPFKAQCPFCKTKAIECRRGVLSEHHIKSDWRIYVCSDRSYMGHEVSRAV